MWIDTHAHLTSDRFEEGAGAVVRRARVEGVSGVVTIASDLDDAEAARELARTLPGVVSTVGVHPHEAARWDPASPDRIRALARLPEVVGIGECGLDFHYDFAPRDLQIEVFAAHLRLSAELSLPCIVHCRDAEVEVAQMLEEAPAGVRGVLHCFSGDPELFEVARARGWYFGYGGIVTFRNFAGESVLRAIPADRLVLETDSPFLAPVPHRGKRNEPAFVARIAERVAEIRGVSMDRLSRESTRNAHELFGWPAAWPEVGVTGSGDGGA